MTPPRKRLIFIGAFVAMAAALYFGWNYAGREPVRPEPVAVSKDPASKRENQPGAPVPARPAQPQLPVGPATQLTTVEEGDAAIDVILRSDKEIPDRRRI